MKNLRLIIILIVATGTIIACSKNNYVAVSGANQIKLANACLSTTQTQYEINNSSDYGKLLDSTMIYKGCANILPAIDFSKSTLLGLYVNVSASACDGTFGEPKLLVSDKDKDYKFIGRVTEYHTCNGGVAATNGTYVWILSPKLNSTYKLDYTIVRN